jgi:P4 family phage/plasmid primase-like protien
MTDFSKIERFLRAVVPWPGEGEPGHVNLHYDFPPKNGKKMSVVPGWAFTTMKGFNRMAGFAISHGDQYLNLWQCMTLQKEHNGPNKTGNNYKAKRLAANAISAKALWIDLDLKPEDPKHYATEPEAMTAVLVFCQTHKLPPPSCIVNSGNGLHMYWASTDPLPIDEWRPLAEGFKALLLKDGIKIDPTVTADAARIMRLPESFNRKDPQNVKPVQLLNPRAQITLYNFSDPAFQALKQHYTPVAKATPKTQSEHFDAAGFTGKRMSVVFDALKPTIQDDKLSAGCERLLHPKPIFDQCPMYDAAYTTGGADVGQPLWHLQILGTTFMEGGNDLAHAISKGHKDYSSDDTDEMFGRKMAERDSLGLGYPSCATFKGAGCEACKSCPLLGKIKSPLNKRPGPNQSGGTGGQQTPKAGKESGDSADERLVVPKDDHMDRARIYRNRKRPNLYHYRDDHYDHEGGHYTIIADDTIRADLYEFLDHCDKEVPCKGKPTETEVVSFAPNKSSVSETGEALKAIGHVIPTVEQPHWLDGRAGPNPADLICFPNGILNINSNQFTLPDPMLFTPHGVGFDYDPNAAEPTQWLNFLDQVFDGEQDQIAALQEMFGYCLSSDVSQEKVFMLLGDKRSGKDTIRHTLQSLLSPTVICGPTLDSMGTNFGMSQLIGKQLAVVGDMRLGSKCDKDLLAEHVLKLSGRGLFTIDRKHKSHWTGPLPCKLLLISNEMPKLKDASGALASRMITFRTRKSFYGREDRHLFENKIKPELPSILLWALDGLRRMRQRGPIAEPACSLEMREELAREGSPIMAFVQECLTLDVAATVDKNVMYSAYLDFAHDNGLQPTSKSWFYRDLDTATASKVKEQRVRKGGGDVHNILGARISNPPPKRPTKNEPIVVYATAPAATTQTAEDIGSASARDVALDEMVANLRTSKTA